jgi:hypothetical protein
MEGPMNRQRVKRLEQRHGGGCQCTPDARGVVYLERREDEPEADLSALPPSCPKCQRTHRTRFVEVVKPKPVEDRP